MNIRIEDLANEINRLPAARFDGQVMRAQVMAELPPLVDDNSADASDDTATIITLRAETYVRGHNRWLEWHLVEISAQG